MELAAVRNIETKARAGGGLDPLRVVLRGLGADHRWTRRQTDTFFHAPRGRLKLREVADGDSELIAYLRPDDAGPRESRFVVLPVARPDLLADLLAEMLGRRLVVRKTRELWLLHGGTVRVHLDQVEALGAFVEIEAVVETEGGVADGSPDAAGFASLQRRRVEELLGDLGIQADDLVTVAYADLLEAKA